MKKLICLLLALVTALSLCACGKTEPTDENEKPSKGSSTQKTEPTKKPEPTETTEPTQPVEPTEEEKQQLRDYISAVVNLKTVCENAANATKFSQLSYYQSTYNKFLEVPSVEKWIGTKWTEWAYEKEDKPETFDPAVDWKKDTVLARFTTVKDTILSYDRVTTDNLGNVTDTLELCAWHYDAAGNIKFITDEPSYTTLELAAAQGYTFRDGLREYDEAGRLSKITEYKFNERDIWSITTFTYDANGQLIKQEYKTNTSGWVIDNFTYDAEGRLTKITWQPNLNSLSDEIYELVYTYNADGTLAKEEKSIYDLKRNGEKVIEDYFCVEYTYNNGKLVSSNYTEKEYTITSSMFEGVTGSWLSSVYTSTRTYTLDEKDRVIQEIEIPGDTVYYTYQGAVQQTKQPSVARYTYNTTYGDYYVYTPAEK